MENNKYMKWAALAAAVVSVSIVNYMLQKQNEKANKEALELVTKTVKVLDFNTLKNEVKERLE